MLLENDGIFGTTGECKSLIEHEILNKKTIPKFITATKSQKPLTKSYVSYETYGA